MANLKDDIKDICDQWALCPGGDGPSKEIP